LCGRPIVGRRCRRRTPPEAAKRSVGPDQPLIKAEGVVARDLDLPSRRQRVASAERAEASDRVLPTLTNSRSTDVLPINSSLPRSALSKSRRSLPVLPSSTANEQPTTASWEPSDPVFMIDWHRLPMPLRRAFCRRHIVGCVGNAATGGARRRTPKRQAQAGANLGSNISRANSSVKSATASAAGILSPISTNLTGFTARSRSSRSSRWCGWRQWADHKAHGV
jgi:hypothetical protein